MASRGLSNQVHTAASCTKGARILFLAMLLGSTIAKADLLPGNLWPNPSLESVSSTAGIPSYWRAGGSDSAIDQWPADSGLSPTHALKLDDASPTAYGEWYSDRLPVVAGAQYRMRYYLKHDTTGVMRVSVGFVDSASGTLAGVTFPFSGLEPEWVTIEQTFTAPEKAVSMSITFASGGGLDTTGTAYLDDLSLVNESGEPTEGPASLARLVHAAYSPNILIDGKTNDWADLPGGVITMDTQGRGTNGTMAVDIQYAWDPTNLYLLITENTSKYTARLQQEAADGTAYQAGPWSVDTIAFWLDLGNDAGTLKDGSIVTEPNADFQPWFGFSSGARTDLMYARVNNSGNMNMDGLANARVATGGAFAQHDRVIEVAIPWADMAGAVDPTRQPGGDLTKAITPGFTFGCEPLLIYYDYNSQAFIGPDQWNAPSGVDAYSIDIQLMSDARVLEAAHSSITVDGNLSEWANVPSNVLTMDTQDRGTNGAMAVDIKYAWDNTNLYVLVKENTEKYTARLQQEAADATSYQSGPWAVDSIGLWLDLGNDAGTFKDGVIVTEPNADFQPWFGFSSSARTDLRYARVNNSGEMNLDGLANARVATGGTFAQHDRFIEVAIPWADMAAAVDPTRQPGGDLTRAITPGFTFGSEPLLVYHDYNSQAFLGPDPWNPGNGIDLYSCDVRLVSGAKVMNAVHSAGIQVDGDASDWNGLASDVLTMDTQGRGTNGTLAVDIKYAWDATNLYVLARENNSYTTAQARQEASDAAAYQAAPWAMDTIAFWMDLDNNAGTSNDGTVVVEDNADFQPWFGFSSSHRTDLMYARMNNSGTMNLAGLTNAKVATGGSFAQHDRIVEAAIAWADIAAAVDPSRQPGGDVQKAIMAGFTFGCEPLLICVDYNAQAFVGPDPWKPGNGVDGYCRDIRLVEQTAVVPPPTLSVTRNGNQLEIRWPTSAVGYSLETSAQLGVSAAWSLVSTAPVIDGSMYKVTISPAAIASFYRLRQ